MGCKRLEVTLICAIFFYKIVWILNYNKKSDSYSSFSSAVVIAINSNLIEIQQGIEYVILKLLMHISFPGNRTQISIVQYRCAAYRYIIKDIYITWC